jgi:hypothetical protein
VFTASGTFLPPATVPPTRSRSPAPLDGYDWSEQATVVSSLSFSNERVSYSSATVTHFTTRGSSLTQSADTVSWVWDIVWVTVGESRIMTLSYRPIQIPVFVTTALYIQIQIRTYTPEVQERNDALIIGMSTVGGLIVALFAGVGYFLLCRRHGGEASSLSSSVDAPKTHDFTTMMPALIDGSADEAAKSDSGEELAATGRAGHAGRAPVMSISVAAGDLDLEGFEGGDQIWV